MVTSYVTSVGRNTPFKDNIPGYDFIIGFEKRWKEELKLCKPDLLTKARAEGLSPFVVDEFFKIYQQVLDENNLNRHPENKNVPDKPTSNDSLLNLPGPSHTSTSRPMPIEIPNPSPMKKLREAIINTLSPEQSTDVKAALKNSKTKRRRV